MKLEKWDNSMMEILDSCIKTEDCTGLIKSLCEEQDESCQEKIDSIFLMMDKNIKYWIHYLPNTTKLVSSGLQILIELINRFQITSDSLCICLSKSILTLIIDENCSILNIKKAINVLNLLIVTPIVRKTLVEDDSLEGTIQICGRKLPSVGDYECQALLYELLYRFTCPENREYWATIWFSDSTARNLFLSMDPSKFELNCRKFLNYINRNEPDRRVFSAIANSISFGTFQLSQPLDSEFWVDFNYDSESISFFFSEISVNNSIDESIMWETSFIGTESVNAYYIKENKAEKFNEVILLLNCPCYNLITSSCITNPAFNSFELKLTFWAILDINQYFEKVYGKEKHMDNLLVENRKISDSKLPIRIETAEKETINESFSFCEKFPGRKISSSSPILITAENEESFSFCEKFPGRKISSSSPIPIITAENVDIVPEVEQNKLIKISESSDVIEIKPQSVIPETQQIKMVRIFKSSDVIEINPEIVMSEREQSRAVGISESHFFNEVKSENETFKKTDVYQKYTGNLNERIVSEDKKCSSINILEKDADEVNDDANGAEHHIMENSGKQEKKVIRGIREKAKLPTTSISLKNISNDILMNETTDKTEITVKEQVELNHNTNDFIKSSTPSVDRVHNVTFRTYINTFKNNDSYSAKICDEKSIHTGDADKDCCSKKNSASSDVFSNSLVIDESQTQEKLIDKAEHYQKSYLNRPLSKTVELDTVSIEKVPRESTMINNADIESPLTHKEADVPSKRTRDFEIVPETHPKHTSSCHDVELNNFSEESDNLETTCGKQAKKVQLSHEEVLEEFLKETNDLEAVSKKQEAIIHSSYEDELDEFSQETIGSNIVSRKQSKKRLYNLDNAPVYDVPPSKPLTKNTVIEENGIKSLVCDINTSSFDNDLNASKQDDSGNNKVLKSNKKYNSSVIHNNQSDAAERMKVYDIIRNSDEDFEEQNIRNFGKKRTRRTLSSHRGRSSKKKTEALQTVTNKKSLRPPREAAVKATKVNKRIFDQTSEVACDEIKVLKASDDSSGGSAPKPEKRRKYSKTFNTLNTDTETGSSEVSWLKQKSCPLFESPKKNYSKRRKNLQAKRNLDVKVIGNVECISKPQLSHQEKKKNVNHTINVENGYKSTWSEFDSINLRVEKQKKHSYPVLTALKNDLQNLSCTTNNRNINEDSSHNQIMQESDLNNADSEDRPDEINLLNEYNEPDIDYDDACDGILDSNSIERHKGSNDEPDCHSNVSEMKQNKNRKHNQDGDSMEKHNFKDKRKKPDCHTNVNELEHNQVSNNYIASEKYDNIQNDSRQRHYYKDNNDKSNYHKVEAKKNQKQKNTLNNYVISNECNNILDNNSKERYNYNSGSDKPNYQKGIHKLKRNQKNISNTSGELSEQNYHIKSKIPSVQLMESSDSLHKKKGSESIKSCLLIENECNNKFVSHRTIPLIGIAEQNEEKGKEYILKRFLKCAVKYSEDFIDSRVSLSLPTIKVDDNEVVNKKVRRAKTSGSSSSWTRRRNKKLQSSTNIDSFTNTVGDPSVKNLKYSKNSFQEDLNFNSMSCENNSNMESYKFSGNLKRKQSNSILKELDTEKSQKRTKLHANSLDLENCFLDVLRLKKSPRCVTNKRKSKITDNHASCSKGTRHDLDTKNEKLSRSENVAIKSKFKSNNVLDNSVLSKLTSDSFKEILHDKIWFLKITDVLSEDADFLTKKLLTTVQKCLREYSQKMCFLREKILQASELFEVSLNQNLKTSKLKNLLQTCKVIRNEVEMSLKTMQMTGKEYFEAEEQHYRKIKRKYIKACKKYLLSMQAVEKNAVLKLEGNILLKTRYFLKKFLKYIDSA